MKRLLTALVISGVASTAMAQGAKPAAPGDSSNSAVTTSSQNNTAKPAPGANSFTETQAKSHIEAAGYTQVSALTKDNDGIWRGKGTKNGAVQGRGARLSGQRIRQVDDFPADQPKD